jgi:protein involved in polysaccharide export with SLBB domain
MEGKMSDHASTFHRFSTWHAWLHRSVYALVVCAAGALSLTGSGCTALHPIRGVPASYLPDQFIGPSRDNKRTIDLSLLVRTPPDQYRLAAGDVISVYVPRVLGAQSTEVSAVGLEPPINMPSSIEDPPTVGYPIQVRDDDTISLPQIPPLNVGGMTLGEAEQAILKSYTVDHRILNPDEALVMVSLQRPRITRVLVVRQETNTSLTTGGFGTVNIGTTGKGTARTVTLKAYENDVLHALARAEGVDGLPGLNAENVIYIIRRRPRAGSSACPAPIPAATPVPGSSVLPQGGPSYWPQSNRQPDGHSRPASQTVQQTSLLIRGQDSELRSGSAGQTASAGTPQPFGGYRSGGDVQATGAARKIQQTGHSLSVAPYASSYRVSTAGVMPQGMPYGGPVSGAAAGLVSPPPYQGSGVQRTQYEAPPDGVPPAPSMAPPAPPASSGLMTGQVMGPSTGPVMGPVMTPDVGHSWGAIPPGPSERALIVPGNDAPGSFAPEYDGSGGPIPENAVPVDAGPGVEQGWSSMLQGFDPTIDNPNVIRIPVRLAPGEIPQITEESITLQDGDIIFIESRETEVFYTSGLLGGGQYTLPRDYDLGVLEAIAISQSRNMGSTGTGMMSSVGGVSALNQDVTTSASRLAIIRTLPTGRRITIEIDLRKAMKYPQENIRIQPGDILFLEYTFPEAVCAFTQRYLLEGALFGVAAGMLTTR